MGEYFKGWRRKIGVVTLLMASVFMGCWIRSLSCDDVLDAWVTRNSCCHFISSNSSLAVSYAWEQADEPNVKIQILPAIQEALMDSSKLVDWKSFPLEETVEETAVDYFAWDWDFRGISFAAENHDPIHVRALLVPDAYIVVPLTLISFWLLFSKPRNSNQNKTIEPVPEKVA